MELAPLQRHVVASDIQPERLAGNQQLTQSEKVGEASRQFESILLKQILDSAQKTVIKSKYSDTSTSASIYHDMVTNQLADSISKSGALGLAKSFDQQLNRTHGTPATAGGEPTTTAMHPLHAEIAVDRPKTRSGTPQTLGPAAPHTLHLNVKHS